MTTLLLIFGVVAVVTFAVGLLFHTDQRKRRRDQDLRDGRFGSGPQLPGR